MAATVDAKKVGNTFSNDEEIVKVLYDFSKDGGALGTIDLLTATAPVVITGFHAVVKTAVTSAGSATVEAGHTGDTDALLTAKAPAALTLNAVLKEDGAFDAVKRLAAGEVCSMTIATAALTAGVVEFSFKVQRA